MTRVEMSMFVGRLTPYLRHAAVSGALRERCLRMHQLHMTGLLLLAQSPCDAGVSEEGAAHLWNSTPRTTPTMISAAIIYAALQPLSMRQHCDDAIASC